MCNDSLEIKVLENSIGIFCGINLSLLGYGVYKAYDDSRRSDEISDESKKAIMIAGLSVVGTGILQIVCSGLKLNNIFRK